MTNPLRIGLDASVRALSLARSVRIARLLRPVLGEHGRPRTLLLAVFVAVAVSVIVSTMTELTELLVSGRLALLETLPLWARCTMMVAFPIVGALVVGNVMTRWFPMVAGSGIPQVKLAYHLQAGVLPGRVVASKLAMCLAVIGSGLSLGREGPSIHIGGAMGSWLARRLAVKRARVKRLCAIGAACGMATAFNAPIAAIMFMLEEIVGDLRHALFGAAVIAVVLATAVSAALYGDAPLLGQLDHAFFGIEVFAYALLGVAAGLGGRLFIRLILGTRAWSARTFAGRRQSWLYVVGGGATGLVTLIAYLTLDLHMVGSSGLKDITGFITSDLALFVLLGVCVGKILATVTSYMTQVPGGIFGPSLFIGAAMGAATGVAFNLLAQYTVLPVVDETAFAVVGMAAFFGGIASAPMTAAMIVVEITDDYGLILPLMLATVLSVLIVRLKYRGSIYDLLLRQDGAILHQHEQHAMLASTTVEDVMNREVRTLPDGLRIEEALAQVDEHDHHGLYVVTGEDGLMVGVVSPTDLVWEVAHQHGKRSLARLVQGQRIIHAHPDQELDNVIEKITHFEFTEFPVVARHAERQVIGVVGLHEITLYRHRLEAEDDREIPGRSDAMRRTDVHDVVQLSDAPSDDDDDDDDDERPAR